MIAHALTAVRLLLVVPVAWALARPGVLAPPWLLGAVVVAVATDFADGKVARSRGTASPRGRLFDHGADFVFVTTGLAAAASAGSIPWLLPPLIVVAFTQYVVDSYWLGRERELRVSRLGRWNGILYFAPIVMLAISRLGDGADPLRAALLARLTAYGLVLSTAVSIVDRALATRKSPDVHGPSTP